MRDEEDVYSPIGVRNASRSPMGGRTPQQALFGRAKYTTLQPSILGEVQPPSECRRAHFSPEVEDPQQQPDYVSEVAVNSQLET